MTRTWALQDAKNRFSEVVNRAGNEGPQTITRRGKPTAVVLSMQDYRRSTARKGDLVSFFRNSPLRGVSLNLARAKDFGRGKQL